MLKPSEKQHTLFCQLYMLLSQLYHVISTSANHLLRGRSQENMKWDEYNWSTLYTCIKMPYWSPLSLQSFYAETLTYIGKTVFHLHLLCGSGQQGRSHLHGRNRAMHHSRSLFTHLEKFFWDLEAIFDFIVFFRCLCLRDFILWYWGLNLRPYTCWASVLSLSRSPQSWAPLFTPNFFCSTYQGHFISDLRV